MCLLSVVSSIHVYLALRHLELISLYFPFVLEVYFKKIEVATANASFIK